MLNIIRKFSRLHDDVLTFTTQLGDGIGFPIFFAYFICLAAIVIGSVWLLTYLGLYGIDLIFNTRIL